MCIASVFGSITLFGMGAAPYADLTKKAEYSEPSDPGAPSVGSA